MTPQPIELITERELAEFRLERLSPSHLLELVEQFVRVLVRVAVGVGKSSAVDGLLGLADLYDRFDLVIYSAPLRGVINERKIVSGESKPPVPYRVFRPRPVEHCGPYSDEWADLEQRGLSALAKSRLCGQCQANRPEGKAKCFWPGQFSSLKGVRLVFVTEQYLLQIRSLVLLLKMLADARRVIVVLDEASLLDSRYEVEIKRHDLKRLASAIEDSRESHPASADRWIASIKTLLGVGPPDLADIDLDLPSSLLSYLADIQAEGVRRWGGATAVLPTTSRCSAGRGVKSVGSTQMAPSDSSRGPT